MRTVLAPATGICRWVGKAANGNPLLSIDGPVYEVEQTETGYKMYRLIGGDYPEVLVYELVTTWGSGVWQCDCPDATHRPERANGNCKHCRALRAALAVKNETELFGKGK